MHWIIFPLVAALLFSFVEFIDNYLVDTYCKKLNPKCMSGVYVALELIILPIVAIIFRNEIFSDFNFSIILLFLAGGLFNVIAEIPYYQALKSEDTTGVTLLAQMSPVLALILGAIFLQEIITPAQTVAFFIILVATVIIVLGAGKKRIKLEAKATTLMLLTCLLWVLSDIVFVFNSREINLVSGLFFMFFGGTASNIILMVVFKKLRTDLKSFLRKKRTKKFTIMTINEVLCIIAEIFWRLGLLAAPVAIMSVTGNAAQLIITFFLGIVLTIFFPKFGREKLSRRHVANHAIATTMMVVAVILIG